VVGSGGEGGRGSAGQGGHVGGLAAGSGLDVLMTGGI
jgi:hypothetical protein